jgi:hypothetical protein
VHGAHGTLDSASVSLVGPHEQHFAQPFERGERRAQLVRSVSHEAALRFERCGQASYHVVECRAESGHLVATGR